MTMKQTSCREKPTIPAGLENKCNESIQKYGSEPQEGCVLIIVHAILGTKPAIPLELL